MEIIEAHNSQQACQTPSVVTIGNFDGVHVGHQMILKQLIALAKAEAASSTVVLFEPQPVEFFTPETAPARLLTLSQKLELLETLGIDRVLVCRFDHAFAEMPAETFVRTYLCEQLRTTHLCVGHDFRFGYRREGDIATLQREADQGAFKLILLDDVKVAAERVSSTRIREYLLQADFQSAEKLLGRPYAMAGEVIHGEKLGRKLNCPTANIDPKRLRCPFYGVYIGEVQGVGSLPHPAAINVGCRPAVQGKTPLLEAHLLDFEGDLYGKHLQVIFLKKLRDEANFASLTALKVQMAKDVAMTRAYFEERLIHGEL